MILKNRSAHSQTIAGQLARPWRTVIVPDGTRFDKNVWVEEKPPKGGK